MDLSVVIPVYNEVESVDALCARLQETLPALNKTYEILLVDDGSTDGTWARMVDQLDRVQGLHLIRLRRNFGQTAAMSAGFHASQGDVVVTLDADLQNDPVDISKLLEALDDDTDVVSGWRRHRKDKFFSRRLPSMLANALISKITGVHLHDYGCTLKAYRCEVIKNVQLYGEMHRFIPALASWVGSGIKEIEVHHYPRRFGTSKYGIGRTLRVVLDLMIAVGGMTEYAAGNKSVLVRLENGQQVSYSLRLDDLVKDGDISANMAMMPGDILIISESWF